MATVIATMESIDDDTPVQAVTPVITTMEAMPWHTPIIVTMESIDDVALFQAVAPIMPPDVAPVQAVVSVITTMEAMPPVMALGGRLKQQQLLRRRLDGHGCRGREIQ